MKKIFLLLTLILSTYAQAQEHFTLWYGVNYAGETNADKASDDTNFKFLNVGIDYTNKLAEKWDWTVGASVNTKSVSCNASYIQAEGNASYSLARGNNAKLAIFTGPYIGVRVSGEAPVADYHFYDYGKSNTSRNYDNKCNTFSCGWQAGLGMTFSYLSLKVGYEHAFTDIYASHKTYQWFARIGLKLELLNKK